MRIAEGPIYNKDSGNATKWMMVLLGVAVLGTGRTMKKDLPLRLMRTAASARIVSLSKLS